MQDPHKETSEVGARKSGRQKEELHFLITPRAEPTKEHRHDNPLAKESTFVPEVIDALRERFGEEIGEVTEYANEQTVYVDRGQIVEICRHLKDELGFNYLSDIGTIDRFTEQERFEVFYSLVNMRDRKRIRLKVRVDDNVSVPTVTGVFSAANWLEREAWDMMGIPFDGHPDPRRMFMPEDFEYHPQRKEFPTLGIPGSLPLPPQESDGEITPDPFARAHGKLPRD